MALTVDTLKILENQVQFLRIHRRNMNRTIAAINEAMLDLTRQKRLIVEQESGINRAIAQLRAGHPIQEIVAEPADIKWVQPSLGEGWTTIHISEKWLARSKDGLVILMDRKSDRWCQLSGVEANAFVDDMEMFNGSMLADDICATYEGRMS